MLFQVWWLSSPIICLTLLVIILGGKFCLFCKMCWQKIGDKFLLFYKRSWQKLGINLNFFSQLKIWVFINFFEITNLKKHLFIKSMWSSIPTRYFLFFSFILSSDIYVLKFNLVLFHPQHKPPHIFHAINPNTWERESQAYKIWTWVLHDCCFCVSGFQTSSWGKNHW